jgi:hypothetical protein
MLGLVLELAKAVTFFLSLASLYWVAVAAFFQPGSRWEDRLLVALVRLAAAGCVCFVSGMLFRWPARSNPDAGQPLTATLPVRLFLWGAAGLSALFAVSWYLVCGAPCLPSIARSCVCR